MILASIMGFGSRAPTGPAPRADFTATSWTIVIQAADQTDPQAHEALEQLCHSYWYPLYAFIRRQGLSPIDAEDVTQGFFHALLKKGYLGQADQNRGRFRTFLLTSIKHYFLNEVQRAKRVKRGGGRPVLALDQEEAEQLYSLLDQGGESPEETLDRSWATTLMQLALDRLGGEYRAQDKAALFDKLQQFLSQEARPGEYDEIARELSVSKNSLGVHIHRLRKRFGELIREEVANTVAHPFDVDDEMRHLYRILAGPDHEKGSS